ncbi:hypothetical protein SELMODRAFT_93784 [Selaginella moellendorffii]|uniref:R2R3-MYB transcription factor n=1 Tax=Selaginella moellendorffii TaxID=88036 RepID=D8RGZ8_SELML|nr:hypothetical protein SELMODRAFT_93784 [Selaginella moellendorffii]
MQGGGVAAAAAAALELCEEGRGRGGGGGAVKGLKKGPWTPSEDAVLVAYVHKHGEGNWNNVQKNCGLSRCGKSCRLRWANHLRPNLKKGAFTPEEERTIIELHAKLGNKWARMASQASSFSISLELSSSLLFSAIFLSLSLSLSLLAFFASFLVSML